MIAVMASVVIEDHGYRGAHGVRIFGGRKMK